MSISAVSAAWLSVVITTFSSSVSNPTEPVQAKRASEATAEVPSTGVFRGQVLVSGASDVVANARLIPVDGYEAVNTEVDGSFEIRLPHGDQQLIVRADGYLEQRVVVRISDTILVRDIRMVVDLDGDRFRTVVESQREVAVSKLTLRDEEIHEVAGTRGDPFRVVKSLPGVAQVAGFLPYVVVRGAAPGNTGYFLDGVRVPILFHVAIGPSVIHPYFIDSVDFYPSGLPARLGRFASGVIEGRTKPARRDRVHGEIDLKLTDAGLLLEVPINRPIDRECNKRFPAFRCRKGKPRGAITMAGRYSYTGLLLSRIESFNVALKFWDYQFRFDHDIGSRFRYTAFAYGSFDSIGMAENPVALADSETDFNGDLDAVFDDQKQIDEGNEPGTPDPFVRFEFHRFTQRLHHRFRNGGKAVYGVGGGLDRSGALQNKVNQWLIAPRLDFLVPINRHTKIGFGVDQEFKIYRVGGAATTYDSAQIENFALVLSDRTVSSTGLYTEAQWRRGWAEVRPGIRLDHYIQVGKSAYLPDTQNITSATGVDPRILFRQRLNDKVTLRQSAGQYHQPPDLAIPIPGIETVGFDRGLQRNTQGSVGYELKLGAHALLTQDAYLGRLNNLLDYELLGADVGSEFELDDFLTNVSGWTYGLETMLKLSPKSRMFGWVAYTLARSTRDYALGGLAPGAWDQTHILNIVLGYKIAHKYSVGGRMHFNTGRPYTSVTSGQTATESLAANRNDSRIPGFFQFDLRAERIFSFERWRLHLTLDVTNSTLSREYFSCGGASVGGRPSSQDDKPTGSLQGCPRPTALRYMVPSLGLRAVF